MGYCYVWQRTYLSFKGVATNHKSTIHLLFVCTWSLLFYSNTNINILPSITFCVPILLCWIFWCLSSCVILYCLMLLTIVVLDYWIGMMEHFLLWLVEIAANWNILVKDGLEFEYECLIYLYHSIWVFGWLYWSCEESEWVRRRGREW